MSPHDKGCGGRPIAGNRRLDSIRSAGPTEFGMGIDVALELSEMMHAAYRSHRERRAIDFDTLEA